MGVLLLDLGTTPRGEAAQELAALLTSRSAMAERADEIDRQQREAVAARDAASVRVAQLEREQAGQAERVKAERTLSAACARADEAWPERRAGALAAVGDADDAT